MGLFCSGNQGYLRLKREGFEVKTRGDGIPETCSAPRCRYVFQRDGEAVQVIVQRGRIERFCDRCWPKMCERMVERTVKHDETGKDAVLVEGADRVSAATGV